jgi:phage shock protein PspC (stress-responsive transcriptional regulator)
MSTHQESIPQRRLVRRREGRVLAGVCTGLADFTGLDVVVFRIGFVLLSIAGASGILAYLLAAVFIPSDGDGDAAASPALDKLRAGADRLRRLPTWLSVVLIAIGAIALAGAIGTPHPAILWAIALILIGVLLLKDDTRPVAPPRDTPIVPRAGPADEDPAARPAAGTGARTWATTSPRQRRQRSPLPWISLSLALVLSGIAILLDQADVMHLQLAQFFGIALATLGTGLLVAARWGRARSLIVIAILLLPVALASSIVRMPLRGTVGEVTHTPSTIGQLRSNYHVLAGKIRLDLSHLNLSGSHEVTIDNVAGATIVYVPHNVTTTVDGHVQAGNVSIFGHRRSGVDLNFDRTSTAKQATGTLDLHLRGTAATVRVYEKAPAGVASTGNRADAHHKGGHHAKP